MDANLTTFALGAAGATALSLSLFRLKERLELSAAKHPSLTGHVRMARRIASLVPFYEFRNEAFFRADGAPDAVARRRRAGFDRLAALYGERFRATRRLTDEVKDTISDLQFTARYRVPFPFSGTVRDSFGTGTFLKASSGVTVTDLDGNRFYDLAGSYGVNLFGNDFYKDCIARGAERVRDLGPVLGAYHPVVAENVRRLRALSGLDEVSFHMSGTEAVMQAVRLARYHTGRRWTVRFAGSYNGWWGDVQPGIGNPAPARDTLTLAEISDRTLDVLRRRSDIACVLVNPLQALHPNTAAPSDSSLVDSSRRAGLDREAYRTWLEDLRSVCDERGIVLILDEVFVGFRLAPGGAQEYFGVKADLVTYGKTLGGGMPIGALCGRAALMRRFREERPGDICFARGTFNAHPYVMGAMHVFLEELENGRFGAMYDGLDERWNRYAGELNGRLAEANLPVRVANLSSIWTVTYHAASRYNWMLQFYLRAQGLALPWTGTGRFIFSLNYGEADVRTVSDRFVAAAKAMASDGWWESGLATDKAIRLKMLREMLSARWRRTAAAGEPAGSGEVVAPAE